MPLDYLSELKESCAIAKSRSLTVTRATKITEWKSAFRCEEFFAKITHILEPEIRKCLYGYVWEREFHFPFWSMIYSPLKWKFNTILRFQK